MRRSSLRPSVHVEDPMEGDARVARIAATCTNMQAARRLPAKQPGRPPPRQRLNRPHPNAQLEVALSRHGAQGGSADAVGDALDGDPV